MAAMTPSITDWIPVPGLRKTIPRQTGEHCHQRLITTFLRATTRCILAAAKMEPLLTALLLLPLQVLSDFPVASVLQAVRLQVRARPAVLLRAVLQAAQTVRQAAPVLQVPAQALPVRARLQVPAAPVHPAVPVHLAATVPV